jgi:large subunit ribosomal protein L24e
MKRNPRKLKWTKAFRAAAGKEMVVDSTLKFAARRNIPVRYNRDQIATTVQAMDRISEIRAKRERAFYKKRMAGNKQRERDENRKLVEENEHLLPRERASVRKAREEIEALGVERMDDVEEQTLEEAAAAKISEKKGKKSKSKAKLLVGGGVEGDEMDVD